jgi:murein DD-endopeptidase MepM/ murein hydrolase activator NlpD
MKKRGTKRSNNAHIFKDTYSIIKKYSIFTLLIFLPLLSFTACGNSSLSKDEIKYITIDSNENISSTDSLKLDNESNSEDINLLVNIINNSILNKHIKNVPFEWDYSLTIKQKYSKLKYYIDFSVKETILKKGKSYYSISNEYVESLFNTGHFKNLFIDNLNPELKLNHEDVTISYNHNGTWSYKTYSSYVNYNIESNNNLLDTVLITSNNDLITYNFNKNNPNKIILKISSRDSVIVNKEITSTNLPIPAFDGEYTYELKCIWDLSDKPYKGEITYSFPVQVDLPATVITNSNDVYLGDCIIVSAKNLNTDETLSINSELIDNEVTLYPYNKYLVGIIPVDTLIKPNTYSIDVKVNSIPTNNIKVNVLDKEFPIQHLTVSKGTNSLRKDEYYKSDNENVAKARANTSNTKLWDGAFIQPVQGRITTEYSAKRYVNKSTDFYRHSGIDIANTLGTKIAADNNGKIVMAKKLIVYGNTIIIDHGMGVFTSYLHLDTIDVKEGDMVKKGDIIATMGTTGFSTGSHLHWTIHNNGVNVNPRYFMKQDPLNY